jgi:hypothetical protein
MALAFTLAIGLPVEGHAIPAPPNGTECTYSWSGPSLIGSFSYLVRASSHLKCGSPKLRDNDLAKVVLQGRPTGTSGWTTLKSKSTRKKHFYQRHDLDATVSGSCDPDAESTWDYRAFHIWQRHDADGTTHTYRNITKALETACAWDASNGGCGVCASLPLLIAGRVERW